MSATERRNIPRVTLEKLAYIHIEPENGGIVLNVSGDGLGFHSMAPVEKDVPLRFSLKEQNRRIDVCGELIWTDEVQKIGGLRFTTLSNEAREQIRDWMTRPAVTEQPNGSSLGAAFLRAFPGLRVRNLVPKFAPSDRLAPLTTKVRIRMSGFSGGLATGLLVSVLAASIFLLFYSHRQQFGETLIHVGERLAAKTSAQPTPAQLTPAPSTTSQSQPIATSPVAPVLKGKVVSSPPATHAAARAKPKDREAAFQDVFVHIPAPPANKPQLNTNQKTAESVVSAPQSKMPSEPAKPTPQPTTNAANRPATPAQIALLLPASATPAKSPIADPINTPRRSVQAQSLSSAPALPPQWFFDLGKFKQQQSAQDLSDRVAQLGMRTSVVNKGHLWMNSYQVLVGPYMTEVEEKKIHTELSSIGIKAHPFERGSRGFAFRSNLTLAGSKLPEGDIDIRWETYVSEAKVKFVQNGTVFATADGKWINRPQKFAHNEYVYENVAGNSHPLLEVHFAGLDRALVFR